MDESSKEKTPTKAMGSLEAPAAAVDVSGALTQRETFGTDQTAPHQAVTELPPDLGADLTIEATPTPLDPRATRKEAVPGSGEATQVGDEEQDARDDLDAKIRRRIAESETRTKTDPLIGKEFGGRFTVTSKVGEGGMGAVYRARQKGMDRDVAVKVLLGDLAGNETVVKRFHLEALAVSKLRHPNTIQIFDFGETEDGLLYIAMEFLEGKSLHQALQEDRVLSARRALNITQQLAKSLREAHAKGIVHRDLKPDNIFLCTVGEEMDYVKVLDFGVAKLRDGDTPGKDLTKTGTIFGTPKYMSPEQAKAGVVDARSDLYALGIILYEMLCGRAPFMSDNSLSILIQHIQEPVPRLDDVQPDLVFPDPVSDLTYRLLAKRAEERPQTAEALIRQIATVLEGLDDIYRNVLTRAEAVEIGLEMSTTPRTRHDTIISTGAAAGAPTEGPFQEPTLAIAPEQVGSRKVVAMAVVAAVALVAAASAAVYASIPPLPAGFLELETFTAVRLGTLPEIDLEMSTVGVTTQPTGIAVDGLDTAVTDPSAFNITRPLGSEPLKLTFSKKGFKSYSYTFHFDEAAPPPVGILLTRTADPRPPVVKVSRPKKPRQPAAAAPKATQPVATRPPAPAPPPAAKPTPAAAVKVPVARPTRLPSGPSKLSKLKSIRLKAPTKLKGPAKLK